MIPETKRPRRARLSRPLLGLVAGFVLFCALPACRSESPAFRIGYMICNSLEETRERFDPLTAYLSEATGARFEAVYLDTFDVESAYQRGEFEFTHTNSLLYVVLRERHGVRPIAAEKRGTFGAKTRGVIIARKDSGLQALADLKGKRVVFGPQWAPFGFLAQYALMLEGGIDPEQDLAYYEIPRGSMKHQKILYAVLYGGFDAGTAPLIDLEEMVADGRLAPDDFTVLGRSALAPYCTFAASPGVSDAWVGRMRAALLALDDRATARAGGETLRVLKRAQIAGYETLTDADYDEIRRWARLAKMPPYEEY